MNKLIIKRTPFYYVGIQEGKIEFLLVPQWFRPHLHQYFRITRMGCVPFTCRYIYVVIRKNYVLFA